MSELRFLADENFSGRIIRGLVRLVPHADIELVTATRRGATDRDLLAYAAQCGRILLTHDVSTMTDAAYERIAAAKPMPGVIAVPEELSIGTAVYELQVVAECGLPGDFAHNVVFLPI